MHSQRSAQRPVRGSSACQRRVESAQCASHHQLMRKIRCRRRKQKCDFKFPNCSNCESSQAVCLTYDSGKQAEIPRNYIAHLETQITKLNEELQALRSRSSPPTRASEDAIVIGADSVQPESGLSIVETLPPDQNSSHLQDLVKSVTRIPTESSTQPRFLGPSSGITLAKLVMAAIHINSLPSPPLSNSYDTLSSTQEPEASLPPRQAADHLVDVYFQYRTAHLPILDRQQAEDALESAYTSSNGHCSSNQAVEYHLFTTYMVLAIALCDLPNPTSPSSRGRPSQSEGCFLSAVSGIERIITYAQSDIKTLRAILLLAQFIALNPSRGSLWHLIGTAIRLCIDIGLHWETEEQTLNTDPDLLHERRKLWYCTYQFDRVMSITLDRPFGIADESVRVPLPNPWITSQRPNRQYHEHDIHNQRAHNHIFNMSKLESEIKHVLQNQARTPKLSNPKINYSAWTLDIQPRLQEWYDTVPQSDKAHPSSIFAQQAYWDSIYHNAILLLHRPNSMTTHLSPTAAHITFTSSIKLIGSIKILQREGKCESLWKTVHQLFMAGMGVIYALWQSKQTRTSHSLGASIAALNSCASTLAAMAETFSGASGCRDIFDTLSAATIDFLVTSDAEEARINRLEFEKQVEGMLQELRPGRGKEYGGGTGVDEFNLSSMLAGDGFSFGEMLSSAAQWPEFRDGEFDDVGMDFLTNGGMDPSTYAAM